MTLPDGFDPNGDIVGEFELVEIDTPDGPQRFILGVDGQFTDVHGVTWVGSSLLKSGSRAVALNGAAPSGSIEMQFYQPDVGPNLVAELSEAGADYIAGREIKFFIQLFDAPGQALRPVYAPFRWMTRFATSISVALEGHKMRRITLKFESGNAPRKGRRGVQMNTAGHARLIGQANPSLENMPTEQSVEQPLWSR